MAEGNEQAPGDPQQVVEAAYGLNRRSLMAHLGLAGLGLAFPLKAAPAAAADSTYAPASFFPRGEFDLDDTRQRKLARLKVFNSLDGSRTYFYTITRHILCPPGLEPYPIHAEMELSTIWLERASEMAGDEAIVRALFTRIPLDPFTFKERREYVNPYLGQTLALSDTLFGGSGFRVSLDAESAANPIIQSDEPHYRIGDDIAFIMFDPRAGQGAFQPRVDTVVWRTNYRMLNDPATSSVEADHSYTAVLKASVYPWSGIADGDPAQVMTMKTGRKVGAVSALPPEVRELLIARYPERV